MEAIVGVWLTSLIGAAAFSAAGYVLGQRGVSIPLLKLMPAAPAPEPLPSQPALPPPSVRDLDKTPEMPPASTMGATTNPNAPPKRSTTEMPTPVAVPVTMINTLTEPGSETDAPPRSATPPPPLSSRPSNRPPGRYSKTPRAFETGMKAGPIGGDDEDDDDDRPTLVPDTLTHAAVLAAATATIPPLRAPSIKVGGSMPPGPNEDVEAIKSELRAAQVRAESAAQRARAAEVVRAELEKQLESVRGELKQELVARASAEQRAEELGDRLVSASEEASSLRHKVALLDKQSKQLREALQGRVRALTTSEWHRRRELEDAEEIRVKLRDVYDKLERSSLPPNPSGSMPPAGSQGSMPPQSTHISSPGMPAVPRSFRQDPSTDDDVNALVTSLRNEIARLSSENQSLKAKSAVGNASTKKKLPSRDSTPDLDLELYKDMLGRVATVAGLRGAVVADELGSVVVGSGDLAEALAAFGAYIKDAGARTDQLLPLEGVEEIDIRDRTGMLFCTRVISTQASELSLVLLASAEQSIFAAKKIAEETLRLRG